MDGIDEEERNIEEVEKILDYLNEAKNYPRRENLMKFLSGPQAQRLLEMVGTSNLLGKTEVSERISRIP